VQIVSVGIDLGKTTFHLVAIGEAARCWCGRSSPNDSYAATDVHRKYADVANRAWRHVPEHIFWDARCGSKAMMCA
jgi:hypothetical protein